MKATRILWGAFFFLSAQNTIKQVTDALIKCNLNTKKYKLSPMDETSTQLTQSSEQMQKEEQKAPSKKTLDFLRNFARVYFPVANMQGLVLN